MSLQAARPPELNVRHRIYKTMKSFVFFTVLAAVTLCVYTMKPGSSCKMTFTSGRLTTAQQVMDEMLRELEIPKENEKVFSIWLTSKHLRKCFSVHHVMYASVCVLGLCVYTHCVVSMFGGWYVYCSVFIILDVELQLKSYHLPCKLFKRWKDLLSQYTTANYEDVQKGKIPLLNMGITDLVHLNIVLHAATSIPSFLVLSLVSSLSFSDEPILSFRRNAFFELREERNLLDPKKDNKKSIALLYHEVSIDLLLLLLNTLIVGH